MEHSIEHSIDNVYKERKPNGKYRYFVQRFCAGCGEPYLTDKYRPSEYCSKKCAGKTRGRPIGTALSKTSKNKIAIGRAGQVQSKETRDKISGSVKEAISSGLFSPNFVSGEDHPWYKHGIGFDDPLYCKWQNIKSRCNNPNDKSYKYYGEKGIKVCEDWANDYPAFRKWCLDNGWESGLHTHRKDPSKDYEPDNCEFLTPSEHSKTHATLRKKNDHSISVLVDP